MGQDVQFREEDRRLLTWATMQGVQGTLCLVLDFVFDEPVIALPNSTADKQAPEVSDVLAAARVLVAFIWHPDPREDLESRSLSLGPYTTKGTV